MSDSIEVALTQRYLQVNPGDRVETDVSVQNAGGIVDVYSIEVHGLAESWRRLSLNAVSLFPGDSATSTLTINLPKSSAATAKTYPFTVKVRSRQASGEETDVSGQLQVEPFYSFTAHWSLQGLAGNLATYALSINNTSNAPLSFTLESEDPNPDISLAFQPKRFNIPPGERLEVEVKIAPGRRPIMGMARAHDFTLRLSPDGGLVGPVVLPGRLRVTHLIPLPGWVIIAVGGWFAWQSGN